MNGMVEHLQFNLPIFDVGHAMVGVK